MKRVVVSATVVLLATVVAVLALLGRHQPAPGGSLILPDGSKVVIAAVTFGTNHVFGSAFSKLVAKLPALPQNVAKNLLGAIAAAPQTTMTPQPSMVLWLVTATNTTPQNGPRGCYYSVFLADSSGFISGPDAHYSGPAAIGRGADSLAFMAWPRRDKQITAEFYQHDPGGKAQHVGGIPFRNPSAGTYPEWKPDPLPARKQNGDVLAVLDSFHTGHDDSTTMKSTAWGTNIVVRGTNRVDGRNHSVIDLRFNTPRADETWQIVGVETSDASGNSLQSQSASWGENQAFAYAPALWPSESAWKLKVEAKRKTGFLPHELIVFKGVPLGGADETNRLSWTTNTGALTLTLDQVCRRAPATNGVWSSRDLSYIKLSHSPVPKGTQLDLIEVNFNTGKTNTGTGWSSDGRVRTYWYRFFPAEAESADIVLAVQSSRYFEFVVKPELP